MSRVLPVNIAARGFPHKAAARVTETIAQLAFAACIWTCVRVIAARIVVG